MARRRPAGRLVQYGSVPTRLAAPRQPGTAPSRARVRLRIAVAGAAVAVVAVGAVCGVVALSGSDSSAVPTQTSVVQVHQGETLSGVAERVAPRASISAVVARIVQLNHLDNVSVRTGQSLLAPVGS